MARREDSAGWRSLPSREEVARVCAVAEAGVATGSLSVSLNEGRGSELNTMLRVPASVTRGDSDTTRNKEVRRESWLRGQRAVPTVVSTRQHAVRPWGAAGGDGALRAGGAV